MIFGMAHNKQVKINAKLTLDSSKIETVLLCSPLVFKQEFGIKALQENLDASSYAVFRRWSLNRTKMDADLRSLPDHLD